MVASYFVLTWVEEASRFKYMSGVFPATTLALLQVDALTLSVDSWGGFLFSLKLGSCSWEGRLDALYTSVIDDCFSDDYLIVHVCWP